jgi:hypothetical protein
VLPIDSCSRRLVPRLRAAGYAVRYREFDGGHGVPPEIASEAVGILMAGAAPTLRRSSLARAAAVAGVNDGAALREGVLGHDLRDLGRDLVPALHGRLDRVGEVGVLVADQAQVDERQAAREGFAGDDVVEQRQPRHRQALPRRTGKRGS